MLGVFYEPLDTRTMLQHLNRAKSGDFQQPTGSIVFETKDDVRTRTRLQQYEASKDRLERKHIDVHMITAEDRIRGKVLGVMAGTATMNTHRYARHLVPGSFADHLTSHAADFDNRSQTKLTQWLDAGAAASIGTVTEPYSIWTKFPEAAFFERYLSGHTLLEALMQSMASPFQTLLVGDPLCSPWTQELTNLTVDTDWEGTELHLKASGVPVGGSTSLHLFVDGKRVEGNGPSWTLFTDAETTGPELDLLLHARYLWAPPELGFFTTRISTPYQETLSLKVTRRRNEARITVRSNEDLVHWELLQGNRRLHQEDIEGKRHDTRLPIQQLGTGPIRVQAKGLTRQGRVVLSTFEDVDFRL
jgi:hypothetical protein